jgi:hypothetical protein
MLVKSSRLPVKLPSINGLLDEELAVFEEEELAVVLKALPSYKKVADVR